MKELNFDSGLVTYSLNGKCEVSFNPTDSNFVERLYSTFEDLDKKQESYKAQIEKMVDKKEIFEFAKERDAEMRGIIDGVFDAPVSESVFGGMNVYAIANGLPVWCNLMMAVMDEIDTTFTREQKLTNPRISKYTAKYQKYQKK
ncbi:MAG: hypothetical protein UCL14_01130 [Collinsella sp.]|jgi:hypothetical protein|uniref:hypothetical protein n=1 Tax=Collinsella sp. TaxID=1965294 RepID=UPI002E75C323|nr:hypothetical protein [Collinsella sp.]MEE0703076.1 hypothetical protein [Collinsella sp.]